MELDQRAEQLARDLIAPMLCGGEVRLQRPFGTQLGALGEGREVVDNELRTRIDNARLRQARRVVAVDVVPPLSAAEWALSGALNDLLQTTNHELSSFVTRGRHIQLLEATAAAVATMAAPATLGQVVCRYATFSRALAIVREDTTVSWWTGSKSFRGQRPAPRLLAWPDLRRVTVNTHRIALCDMDEGVALPRDGFDNALNHWLHHSPLVDLAHAARPKACFVWSAPTLGVVSSVAGCNLALRAITAAGGDSAYVVRALWAATKELPKALQRWPAYLTEQLQQAAAADAAHEPGSAGSTAYGA